MSNFYHVDMEKLLAQVIRLRFPTVCYNCFLLAVPKRLIRSFFFVRVEIEVVGIDMCTSLAGGTFPRENDFSSVCLPIERGLSPLQN